VKGRKGGERRADQLRRCRDCEKYDVRLSFCRAFNRPIDTGEASYPTFSSDSTYCREYVYPQPAR